MQQNAIKNLKNGLFEVKFDGDSAELWCSKAQGESFFQTRCDFGSFRDLFLGAVYSAAAAAADEEEEEEHKKAAVAAASM